MVYDWETLETLEAPIGNYWGLCGGYGYSLVPIGGLGFGSPQSMGLLSYP